MHSRQSQPAAADRRTEQIVEVQQQGLGDGIGTVPQLCQVRTRYAALAAPYGVRTQTCAYARRCGARQQC